LRNNIFIVMGVSGSGKSTIGAKLAAALSLDFLDGDDFHPPENIAKMAAGIPLDDTDRLGWLKKLNSKAIELKNTGAVFACSSLKESYRQMLCNDVNVNFVYLKGTYQEVFDRLSLRKDHFMPPALLKSQFDALEEPINAIAVSLLESPENIIIQIMQKINKKSFGLVGLGVMGKSLARNLARNNFSLSLYNRYVQGSEEKIAEKTIAEYPEFVNASGFEDLETFVNDLETPRNIFLMIKAGKETDEFIDKIVPFMEKGDVLIDGGNSHFADTKRRIDYLQAKGIYFVGTGVSGGEKGALEGPSIMPSGPKEALDLVTPFLMKIAAKDKDHNPCCALIGPEGSGHFIKMVHNGVEYAEMQLLAEVYAYFRYVLKQTPDEISKVFHTWNQGKLKSYLLEITAKLLTKKEGDTYIIDQILDKAGNKGTGNWTTVTATEMGMPATMITAALFARYISTIKHNYLLELPSDSSEYKKLSISEIANAYEVARMVNHQQGFELIRTASETYNWELNLSEIARIWTNGCIIRSGLMEEISTIFETKKDLFAAESFVDIIKSQKVDLKAFCMGSLSADLPIPTFTNALDFLNGISNHTQTANIIQAQRDFFGAHTYQRRNDPSGKSYHTIWE
jgi:6-phosphogluconate dehydrogenase